MAEDQRKKNKLGMKSRGRGEGETGANIRILKLPLVD